MTSQRTLAAMEQGELIRFARRMEAERNEWREALRHANETIRILAERVPRRKPKEPTR